ncbi:Vacuolar amino acid permease [Mycena chlorophos]|uniref:Vacuolar amino acid permease n=1 Tax=Mycena chlorophos TaxID=658473 RepID=A0A8H6WLU7_MYCCL|nr:Vacuolar amino acid permease [Mycena chlorophos]
MSSERQPLLAPAAATDLATSRPGPLEISAWERRAILCGIWLATFLGALNSTLVPTMMPAISSDFQKFHQAGWLGTAYLLATCTFTPLYGRLCNVMGRRRASHTALLFAASGALACALSTNMEMLIAARFIAGMGGGGMFTTASIIVSDMYTLRNRGLVQGVASCVNALGTGLGGVFGGIMTDWLGWRAAFFIQLPLFFLSFALTSNNLRYVMPGKSKSAAEVLKRIDYFGILTLLTALGSLLVFLSMRYNEMLPWSDPWVFLPLAGGGTFLVLFFLVEALVASDPVLSPSMLGQQVPSLIALSNFLSATCNFSVSFFFPVWFQTVMMESATTAGAHITPNSIAASLGSVVAGLLMHRFGRYKAISLVFGWFPFVGAVLLSRMTMSSGPLQSWLSIIPFGFGNAIVMQTNLSTFRLHPEDCQPDHVNFQSLYLLIFMAKSQTAVGTGFAALFRGMGASISSRLRLRNDILRAGQVGGVAISSAIFQSRLETSLKANIHSDDAAEIIEKVRRSSNVIRTLPPLVQLAVRESYASGLRAVFVLAATTTFLAYVARLPIPDQDLDKAYSKRRKPSECVDDRRNAVAVVGGQSGERSV